jgi:hypothetical protein
MKKLIILIIGIVNISYAQQSKTLTKVEVINLYNKLYLSSEIDTIIWNGNTKLCQCGSLDKGIYLKAENRINFFRTVVGLPTVKINLSYNKEAQAAALLIKANNQLTHYPSKEMKCFNQSASNGCLKSCLAFTDFNNFPKTAFITAFIDDLGADNYFVGHRKWLLYTKLVDFGYGATNSSEAVLTSTPSLSDSIPSIDYIAYPWKGFVPVNLIFPKWSFSIPENKVVDFSSTTITMTNDKGIIIKIEKLKEYKNYLDHTIVWTVTGLFSENDITYSLNKLEENGYLNKRIKVSIKNVKIDGVNRNFEYFVEPIKI